MSWIDEFAKLKFKPLNPKTKFKMCMLYTYIEVTVKITNSPSQFNKKKKWDINIGKEEENKEEIIILEYILTQGLLGSQTQEIMWI